MTQQQTQQKPLNNNNKIDVYRFYIGSNNKTKLREINKTISLLNSSGLKGYSIIKSLGLWENMKENSFIIEVMNTDDININDNKAYFLKNLLEEELKQYLVLLVKSEIEILN
jgi:hypothetical protein